MSATGLEFVVASINSLEVLDSQNLDLVAAKTPTIESGCRQSLERWNSVKIQGREKTHKSSKSKKINHEVELIVQEILSKQLGFEANGN